VSQSSTQERIFLVDTPPRTSHDSRNRQGDNAPPSLKKDGASVKESDAPSTKGGTSTKPETSVLEGIYGSESSKGPQALMEKQALSSPQDTSRLVSHSSEIRAQGDENVQTSISSPEGGDLGLYHTSSFYADPENGSSRVAPESSRDAQMRGLVDQSDQQAIVEVGIRRRPGAQRRESDDDMGISRVSKEGDRGDPKHAQDAKDIGYSSQVGGPIMDVMREEFITRGIKNSDIDPSDQPEARQHLARLYDLKRKSREAKSADNDNDANLKRYTDRVMKDLNIDERYREDVGERLKAMHEILKKSEGATSVDEYDEACRKISEFAPKVPIYRLIREGEFGKVSGVVFFGGKETRLETNNIRTRGELQMEAKEAPDDSAGYFTKGRYYLSKGTDHVMKGAKWRLNRPMDRFILSATLGGASIATAYAFSKEIKPVSVPVSIAATYADTAIFKKFDYPANLVITTLLWQGSSFVTEYLQEGVDALAKYIHSHH
jgi:hypothetical protein